MGRAGTCASSTLYNNVNNCKSVDVSPIKEIDDVFLIIMLCVLRVAVCLSIYVCNIFCFVPMSTNNLFTMYSAHHGGDMHFRSTLYISSDC